MPQVPQWHDASVRDLNIDLPEAEEMSDSDVGNQGLDQDVDDIVSDDDSEHESVNSSNRPTSYTRMNDESDDFYLSRDGKTNAHDIRTRNRRRKPVPEN